jgi:hypothetical protein
MGYYLEGFTNKFQARENNSHWWRKILAKPEVV